MPEVRLLTYNIMLKPSLLLLENNEFKAERAKLFCAQYLANYDVVCFQETYDSWHSTITNFLEEAAKLGFGYMAKSSMPGLCSSFIFTGGLTILSRFPILDSEELTFTPGLGQDRGCTKGALYAKIALADGRVLHLVDVHPQAHYPHHSEADVYLYKHRRLAQLGQLKRFVAKIVRERHEEGDLSLLCGDFNVDWNEEEDFRDYSRVLGQFAAISDGLRHDFTNEYDLLMRLFNWKNGLFRLHNVHLEQRGHQAVTYGDYTLDDRGRKVPKERVLTDAGENCCRNGYDYIFRVDKYHEGVPLESMIQLKPDSCVIEEFRVDVGFLSHLSDHFGLSVALKY